MHQKPSALNCRRLSLWLKKAGIFVGLTILLSGAILLLTGCAGPCHPALDLTRIPSRMAGINPVGAINSLGFECEWRY